MLSHVQEIISFSLVTYCYFYPEQIIKHTFQHGDLLLMGAAFYFFYRSVKNEIFQVKPESAHFIIDKNIILLRKTNLNHYVSTSIPHESSHQIQKSHGLTNYKALDEGLAQLSQRIYAYQIYPELFKENGHINPIKEKACECLYLINSTGLLFVAYKWLCKKKNKKPNKKIQHLANHKVISPSYATKKVISEEHLESHLLGEAIIYLTRLRSGYSPVTLYRKILNKKIKLKKYFRNP